MRFSDDTLVAYADGELDAKTRASIEAAMAADPEIAAIVAHHRELRDRQRTTLEHAPAGQAPQRLVTLVRSAPAHRETNVVPLRPKTSRHWDWTHVGAIAASLVLGILAGQLLRPVPSAEPVTTRDGTLMASDVLSAALSSQLTSEQPSDAPLQIGVSFRAKTGDFCRSFTWRGASVLAGLACRDREGWRLEIVTPASPVSGADNPYRQGAVSIPSAVLQAVETRIGGEPLDAHGEREARAHDWSR